MEAPNTGYTLDPESSWWEKANRRANIQIGSGGNITGAVADRIRQLFALADERMSYLIAIEPGDLMRVVEGSSSGDDLFLRLPIAADIWFLRVPDPLFKEEWEGERFKELFEDKVLQSKGGGVKALNFINDPQLVENVGTLEGIEGQKQLKTCRFEFRQMFQPFKNWGKGPKSDVGAAPDPDKYVAFIDFPVGPLGVMESVSMLLEDGPWPTTGEDSPMEGRKAFPPYSGARNKIMGKRLVRSGYLVEDFCEFPAPIDKEHPEVKNHQFLRVFLDRSQTGPIPGEFVGLLGRPFFYWFWWWQKSQPTLLDGMFMETEFYKGGVVVDVIREKERGGPYGDLLKVRCGLRHIWVETSDFAKYDKGDRVALLKKTGDKSEKAFTWNKVRQYDEEAVPVFTELRVLPVVFCGKEKVEE